MDYHHHARLTVRGSHFNNFDASVYKSLSLPKSTGSSSAPKHST
jgi:hypothetical protein